MSANSNFKNRKQLAAFCSVPVRVTNKTMAEMHENIETYLIAHKSEMDEQLRLKAYKRWPYKKDPKRPEVLCYAEKVGCARALAVNTRHFKY